jgi:hypothetical protein
MTPKATDFTHIPRVALVVLLVNFLLWLIVLPFVMLTRSGNPNWLPGMVMFALMVPLSMMMMFIWRLLIYFWYVAFWYVQSCAAIIGMITACGMLTLVFTNPAGLPPGAQTVIAVVPSIVDSPWGTGLLIASIIATVSGLIIVLPGLLKQRGARQSAPAAPARNPSTQRTAKPWWQQNQP